MPLAAELTLGGVNSACYPSEIGKMSTSVMVEGQSVSDSAVSLTNDATSSHKAAHESVCVVGQRLGMTSMGMNEQKEGKEQGRNTKTRSE